MIKALYDNSTSAVLINNTQGKLLKTTVGVRKGCPLSPILFNVFIKEIMAIILYNYSSSISIENINREYPIGTPIGNLKFSDDIYLLTGTKRRASSTDKQLDKICRLFQNI